MLYNRGEGSAFYIDMHDAPRSLLVGSPRFKKMGCRSSYIQEREERRTLGMD
jgi:hypothetical protein